MPGKLAWSFAEAEAGLAALAVVAVALLAVFGYRVWRRSRISPEERERRRRVLLNSRGKMGEATLVDVREDLLFFTYDVRGMEYTASQDVTALKEHLPADLTQLNSIAVKYLPENPANSIVLSEEWSGLRAGRASEPRR